MIRMNLEDIFCSSQSGHNLYDLFECFSDITAHVREKGLMLDDLDLEKFDGRLNPFTLEVICEGLSLIAGGWQNEVLDFYFESKILGIISTHSISNDILKEILMSKYLLWFLRLGNFEEIQSFRRKFCEY